MATWSNGVSLRGVSGAMLRYGHGAPTASNPPIQNDLDSFLDVDTGRLYAVRQNGQWPTSYATLAAKDGAAVRSGNGAPSSSSPTVQADGDFFLQLDASGGPALWGPRANGSWPSSPTPLVGPAGRAGSQITYVSQDPGPQYAAQIGAAVGDIAYQTVSRSFFQWASNGNWTNLGSVSGTNGTNGSQITFVNAPPGATYGAVGDFAYYPTTQSFYSKTSTGWASLGSVTGAQGPKGDTGAASTVPGPAGATITSITGAPSSSNPTNQKDGDYALQTDADAGPTLFGPRASGAYPSTGLLLRGNTGASGLSVLSGTSAPTASQGVDGQPAFINTATGALYGAKASGAWPSTPTSLVGPQGPPAAQIYSGTGAPSSSNPGGTVQPGSFFIETDTTPNRLFGPYTSANGWPTSYTAMGGGNFLTTSGPPASATGSVGDVAIDVQNALFYPPKTASGWTASPINLVGPAGPSMQVQPTFGSYSQSWGPSAYLNNVTVSSTATPAQVPGLTQTQYFVPTTASAFVGGMIVNYTNSAGSLTFTLYNLTAGTSVYSTTIAKATVSNLGNLGTTAYPLTAGSQYVWNVTGSGAAYCTIMPLYLTPSSYSGTVGAAPTAVWTSAAVSSTAAYLSPAGAVAQYYYMQSGFASYLYNVQAQVTGTNASCQLQLYNATATAVIWQSPVIAASAAGTVYQSGNLGISAAYIPANAQCNWRITGSGTLAASVNAIIAQ